MIDLTNFFTIQFLKLKVSFENKKLGSDDHIGKLISQNINHERDLMIADTKAAHDGFFGKLGVITFNLGEQTDQTADVDKIIADFQTRCTELNGYFIYTKLIKTPLYKVFFPLGVMEYTQHTNKGNVENYMEAMVLAITAHTAAAGGISVLNEFIAFQTNYGVARGVQTTDKGLVSGSRDSRDEAEVVWATQMHKNLLTLALEFIGQPEKMHLFFSQQYFQEHRSTASDHVGTLTGKVTRGHTTVAEPDVKVHVVDGNISDCYTKPDGTFRTHKLPIGFHTVQFSKAGFIMQEITIEILNDEETIADVMLELNTQEVS